MIETLISAICRFQALADEIGAILSRAMHVTGSSATSLTEAAADIQRRREAADKTAHQARLEHEAKIWNRVNP